MVVEVKDEVELNSILDNKENIINQEINDRVVECYRGDIFFIESTENEIGCEMQKKRPGLIVSNDSQNKKAGMVTVVYLTTQEKRPLPTHVPVISNGKVATAMCEHIETVSKERLDSFLNSATDEEMKRINGALLVAFELNLKSRSKKNWELWEKLIENNELSSKLIELENGQLKEQISELQSKDKISNSLIDEEKEQKNDFNDFNNINNLKYNNEDYIKVCAERDTYKEMYNNLLALMFG